MKVVADIVASGLLWDGAPRKFQVRAKQHVGATPCELVLQLAALAGVVRPGRIAPGILSDRVMMPCWPVL